MKHFLSILTSLLLISSFSSAKQPKVYLVSNAHFDSQWNWDVQTSIREYIPKTLNQNLFLLAKYPNYVFNFEGGIKYSWMKEYFPDQYEMVKQYVKQGRWHIPGSTWDATDAIVPSAESFTRNILYGQQFYRDEFGVTSTDIFLPDCFGFGWTLPTIAAHSGIIGFSTQKLQWRNKPFFGESRIPFEIGLWQGVDGSKVMMVADAHNYTTKWHDEDLSNNEYLYDMANSSPLKTLYHYYGTGDTGGAPTIESVRALEKGVASKGKGKVEIISATSDQLFKDYLPYDKHPELPLYNGELLMDLHGTGCYTSQAAMKLYNRRNELVGDAGERAAVVADWLGALSYPKATLTEAWKRFIWHQFHDDLTGTSTPRVYQFSWNDELISLQQFSNVLTSSVGAASRALNTQVKGVPLVIYNPAGFPVSDVVEIDVELPKASKTISVYNENGVRVPTQILANTGEKVKMLVSASVPAVGYVVYDIRTGGTNNAKPIAVGVNSIENSIYKVTVDANGDISSIVDKRNSKELVKEGKSIRLALFTENESFGWPAWEIFKKTMDKDPISITEDVKISVGERGPVRASLCVERKHGKSAFKQYITLTEGEQNDRIDVVNEIDWLDDNALLKAEFPLSAANHNATYDLGIGAVQRGNNTETAYEVYAQQWADLTDKNGAYGVSIINNCKYGWDKPNDNTVRLTLLHTPKTMGGFDYQSKQDQGKHQFTYSIIGHDGDYHKAGTVMKAEIMNQPLTAFVATKHAGTLGKSFSFVGSDNSKVVLKAVKQAETSNEYVVRLYETEGKQTQAVNLSFAANIAFAKEINGVEDVIGDVSYSGNKLNFDIKPFGMKSFKVTLKSPENMLAKAVSVPVTLPYNMKISTYNSFRQDANFDGVGNSFSSELLPSHIDFKGVNFKLAGADVPNGVKCRNNKIDLPQGNFNRLYLLAASTNKDYKAKFIVDGVEHIATVPYYSGFIGQWGHAGHTEGFLKSSDVAYVGTHAHNLMKNEDVPYEFTYMFCIALDIPANSRQLILPDNSKIVVFAATIAQDDNNLIVPATDILDVNLPPVEIDESNAFNKNYIYGKSIIDKSGETNSSEAAEFATDEDISTKWCDVSITRPKYIVIDLEKEESLKGWTVMHAGLEALDYITKEYSLQVKSTESDEWRTIDSVRDNTAQETDRLLNEPVKARFVRLTVTKPDQSEGSIARIYEFSVY